MEVSSSHQIYVFFLCVLCGMWCGMFFDLQRFLRKIFRSGMTRTLIEDILFSLVCVVSLLAVSFRFNNGEIRYYEVVGALGGALLYSVALSRIFTRILEIILKIFTWVFVIPAVKIFAFIMVPIRKLTALSKKFLQRMGKTFSTVLRRLKKRQKHLKKRIKML